MRQRPEAGIKHRQLARTDSGAIDQAGYDVAPSSAAWADQAGACLSPSVGS